MTRSNGNTPQRTSILIDVSLLLASSPVVCRADDALMTVVGFQKAKVAGDAATARNQLTPDAAKGDEGKMVDADCAVMAAYTKFDNAAVAAKLGKADSEMNPEASVQKDLDKLVAKVTGKSAVVSVPQAPVEFKLAMTGVSWKINQTTRA